MNPSVSTGRSQCTAHARAACTALVLPVYPSFALCLVAAGSADSAPAAPCPHAATSRASSPAPEPAFGIASAQAEPPQPLGCAGACKGNTAFLWECGILSAMSDPTSHGNDSVGSGDGGEGARLEETPVTQPGRNGRNVPAQGYRTQVEQVQAFSAALGSRESPCWDPMFPSALEILRDLAAPHTCLSQEG